MNDAKKYSAYRTNTDRHLSRLWLLIPVSSLVLSYYVLIALFLTIESILSALPAPGSVTSPQVPPPVVLPFPFDLVGIRILEAISLVPAILFLYFIYLLIKRRNLHFERQNRLLYSAYRALAIAAPKDPTGHVDNRLREIDFELRAYRSRDSEKSAILWVILLIVPVVEIFAYFYIFHFLTENFQDHEERQHRVLLSFSQVFREIGVPFVYQLPQEIRYGRFWPYLVLTFVTLGIFGIYWEYLLITGPNKHFEDQAKAEDYLISALSSLLGTATTSSRTSS